MRHTSKAEEDPPIFQHRCHFACMLIKTLITSVRVETETGSDTVCISVVERTQSEYFRDTLWCKRSCPHTHTRKSAVVVVDISPNVLTLVITWLTRPRCVWWMLGQCGGERTRHRLQLSWGSPGAQPFAVVLPCKCKCVPRVLAHQVRGLITHARPPPRWVPDVRVCGRVFSAEQSAEVPPVLQIRVSRGGRSGVMREPTAHEQERWWWPPARQAPPGRLRRGGLGGAACTLRPCGHTCSGPASRCGAEYLR